MNDYFNPKPNEPYGKCRECSITIDTPADADKHMHDSLNIEGAKGRSHAISVSNPRRETRVRMYIHSEIENALDSVFEELLQQVDDGQLHADEIEKALKSFDVVDNWKQYLDQSY